MNEKNIGPGRPHGTTKTNNKQNICIRLSPELLSQVKERGKPNKVIEDALIKYFQNPST